MLSIDVNYTKNLENKMKNMNSLYKLSIQKDKKKRKVREMKALTNINIHTL